MTRTRRRWPVAIAVVMLAIVLLIVFWDWNWFKGPIERRVSQQTGREFVIDGDLDVDPGFAPRIRLDGVRLSNPSWTRERQMLTAERAEFTVDLWQLVRGRLVLPVVHFVAPKVDLETAPGGANNWTLATRPPEDRPAEKKGEDQQKGLPAIGLLSVDRGKLIYFDPQSNTDLDVEIATTRDEAGHDGLKLGTTGRYKALDLTADAAGGPVLSLENTDVPYPVKAKFRVGHTEGAIDGTVTGIEQFAAADLQVEVKGDTLADLYPLAGLALPGTPPYRVAGRLEREGDLWKFHGFQGQVGDSDLSGDVDVRYTGRPRFVATLASKQVDLDDLAGFIGATPQTGAGETAAPEQKQQAASNESDPRLLPDRPLNLSKLQSMDADVRFVGQSIRDKRLPVEKVDVHLVLQDGVLKADPLSFGVAGGDITSTINIDARQDQLVVGSDVQFRKLDLQKLLPGNDAIAAGGGLLGGRAKLEGRGRSLSELLATANGDAGLAMRGGQVSHLLLEAVGLDAAEAFERLLRGDHEAKLRCAVADFSVVDGLMTARSFVVDTTDTNIHVVGDVNLKDEKLDLTINPLPKDWSPLSLRSPIHVNGTFKHPAFGVDRKLVAKSGIAVALGALVNPLAALLPLIETGPGKNAECGDLIAAVEKNAQTKAP